MVRTNSEAFPQQYNKMIAVVQRVKNASVTVESEGYDASINHGLCVLIGIEEGDQDEQAIWMAKKIAKLRIFSDEEGKMNCSVIDVQGEILLVSQFTLAGDCTQGNRPSFVQAADPSIAAPLVNQVGEILHNEYHIPVKQGLFGAMMQVGIVNDGPVTLILKRD